MINKILFIVLALTMLILPQSKILLLSGKGFYTYTPVTGSASVSEDMVQIFGSETRTKSNKLDTLATKKSPQRWMVWFPTDSVELVDSSQGLSKILYDLPEDIEYTYYHSIFTYAVDGDTIYSKGAVDTFITQIQPPENLIADGGINKIDLTWIQPSRAYETFIYVSDSIDGNFTLLDSVTTNSYSHVGLGNDVTKAYKVRIQSRYGDFTDYSNIADASSDEEVIPLSLMSYAPDSLNFGTVDTLNFTVVYDSTISDIDTTGWTYTDSTAVIDTIAGGTPDLQDYMLGTAVGDFTAGTQNSPHTFTASGGFYNVVMDSGSTFNETNYKQKTFTGQSDSLFVYTKLIIPASMTTRTNGDAMELFGIKDTVVGVYTVGFGIDDSNSDGTPDIWALRYKTGAGQITATSATNYSTGTKYVKISWNDITDVINVWVNDTLIFNRTSLDLATWEPNAVVVGNAASFGTSEYIKKATFSYDSVYADSRGFVTSGVTYDTTWTYTDSTAILDTTWIANNDTTYYIAEQIVYAENVGETTNEIISIAGLSAPFSVKPDFTTGVVAIGSKQAITIQLDRGYALGTYTDTLVITDNEGANNIIVTGVLTTPALIAPTNLTVTHNTDTTAFKLDWDKSLSTHDSTRIYISSDGITFTWIASVGSAVETYNAGTFGAGDKRYFRIAALRSGTISDYTSIVNYTLPNPPAPPESGNWTYDLYVTVTGAGDHSGVDLANAMTLSEAVEGANRAVAGDTVFIQKGLYVLPDISGGNLAFNENGTFASPIIFRGERSGTDFLTDNGTNNTVIRGDWNVSSGALSVSGAYTTITNLVLQQEYTDRVTNVLDVNSGASYFTLDSVVVRYPDNNSSSSYHTVLIYADNVTLRDCYFYQGCRTIIWVRASGTNTCDNFLMEGCTLDGYDNHYAIQCMPTTTTVGIDPKLTNGIIRNNVFKNSGYESAIYLRNVYNYKVYNNVFVNAGGRYGVLNFYATDGTNPEDAYDASSIFANNTIYDNGGGEVRTEAIGHLITNMNGWTFKNNLISMVNTATTYIWKAGCGLSNTPALQDCEIDYNMYYNSLASISSKSNIWTATGSCTSTTYNWTNWKGVKGFDTHTIIDTAPDFTNATTDQSTWDFRLGTQRAGVDLSSWGITTDYNGVTRTNWTMGAYEYVP